MGRYVQGKYIPKNREKWLGDINNLIYRSSYELKFFEWADRNKSVIEVSSEEVVIPYVSPLDGRIHRYFLDIYIKIKDKNGNIKKLFIEIKPKAKCYPPKKQKRITKQWVNQLNEYLVNKAKWVAAKKYAEKCDAKFIIITEKQLGIK